MKLRFARVRRTQRPPHTGRLRPGARRGAQRLWDALKERPTQPFQRPSARTILRKQIQPGEILDAFDRILGWSPEAETIRAFGRRAASVDATVLLTGETGTGKGILARAIHECSARARAPFVAVNCAGVPESLFESEFFGHVRGAFTGALHTHRGLLEQADRGTLFLDEIGELPPALQAKLLTALDDGEYRKVGGERTARFDARLIAATCVDLENAVQQQRFRSDLYHRLRVLEFRIPPLRERIHDIAPLAGHFLQHCAFKYRRPLINFAPDSLALLEAHPWPGNVRELAHTIEAAFLASGPDTISVRALRLARPSHGNHNGATSTTAQRYRQLGSPEEEAARIQETLEHFHGNRTHAARALGMARNTLLAKIRKLRL